MSSDVSRNVDLPDGPWKGPRRRVLVAMSGGVDSSLVAALLKAAGHDVIGVTLQLYDHGAATGRSGACCAGQDIHDARRVADALAIPHYVLDYEARFRRDVIETFAASYARGETPIPCVTCNQRIKFGELLETAGELGAEVMATGHYVERREAQGAIALHCAADPGRDQSYFLFATTRTQLQRLWFPLGGLLKRDVRALAQRLALPVADKPDSQDICFVPSGRYADVVARLRPEAGAPGDIVHIDGRVLGRHAGIMHYTIGQRRGLGVAVADPLFVVRIDAARSEVVVGPRSALATTVLELRDVNWLADAEMAEGMRLPLAVRVRSSGAPRAALLEVDGARARVVLDEPEPGVAAGQACVFYANAALQARVLGGGIIARSSAAHASELACRETDRGRDALRPAVAVALQG